MTESLTGISYKPSEPFHWVAAVLCGVFLLFTAWMVGHEVYDRTIYDDSPLVYIDDYHPERIELFQGDPIAVNYLYRKRECEGKVTYVFQRLSEEDERVTEQFNSGPFTASWPDTQEPRWIKQIVPVPTQLMKPGRYDLFWKFSSYCRNSKTERPSKYLITTTSPTTRLVVKEAIS